jgi:hypothetical protein
LAVYGGYLTPEGPDHEAGKLSVTGRKADPPFPTRRETPLDLSIPNRAEGDRKADPPYPTIVKPIRTETGLLLEISLPAAAIERAKLEDGTLEIRVITEPEP